MCLWFLKTYQHKGVYTLMSRHKVPYMECEVDPRNIPSRFHVHKASFLSTYGSTSIQTDSYRCSKDHPEDGSL